MSRIIRPAVLLLALVFAISSFSEAAIRRVAKRWNVIETYGGYSTPIGSYSKVGVIDLWNSDHVLVDVDANRVYDPTFHLGINYGQLRGGHLLYSIGFRYTRVRTPDTFWVETSYGYMFDPPHSKLNQYDIDFNLNYLTANISKVPIAPYVGLGFHGGITSQTATGYESENWLTFAASLNFGADFKLWGGLKDRSFVTLSSINRVDILGSDQRPRYLNFGVGLKYYFSP